MPASRAKLTQEYHETILRLVNDDDDNESLYSQRVARDVSQHALDQLWKISSDDASTATKWGLPNNNHNQGNTTTTYACQACGYVLYPGWKGTTLRVQRPKPCSSLKSRRTIRRRLLRKRKQAALAQDRKAKDEKRPRRNSSSSGKPNGDDTAAAATTKSSSVVLLRDDPETNPLDRNRLVLTCGRCGDKTYLKGLKRNTATTAAMPRASKQTQEVVQGHRHRFATTSTTTTPKGDLSEAFERLPSAARTSSNKRPFPRKPPPPANLSLLEQKLYRPKNRKKATQKKSGNLMGFLNSLNDH